MLELLMLLIKVMLVFYMFMTTIALVIQIGQI